MKTYINAIQFNKSLVDGPGIRSLIFFQGCNLNCKGCHNKSAWDMKKGTLMGTEEIVKQVKEHSINGKVTITGGEPLLQYEALIELIKELKDYDITLYSGFRRDQIPDERWHELWKYVKHIKLGPFIQELYATTKPFVGSSNQEFLSKEDE